MRSIIHLTLFSIILITGCATAQQNYQPFYDPEYKVIDRGELDVTVISRACSDTFEDALSAAKNNGKFHLRSVVGNQNHRIKNKEVRSYNKQNKICVEMSASSFPP